MKIVTWNVNGLPACKRKGFIKFLVAEKPDIMCCQEIKTKCPLKTPPGYEQYWNIAKKSHYSGTLILTRKPVLSHTEGIGISKFDEEARTITLEFRDYYLVNVYVPNVNTNSPPDRMDFRIEWNKAFHDYLACLTKPVIVCGDMNVAYEDIDYYPENQKHQKNRFFDTEERNGFSQLLSLGLKDAFRAIYPYQEGVYSWWGPKNKDRAENRGSRLDYFLVSPELLCYVQNVKYHNNILASDHCPVSMQFYPVIRKFKESDEDLALMWRSTDFDQIKAEVRAKQKEIALAAYYLKYDEIRVKQNELVYSRAARMYSVYIVSGKNSSAGVDGIKWTSDSEKMKAALSLSPHNYRPFPYMYHEMDVKGKKRIIHVPIARDKAMLTLYALALDPVAETWADKKSFSARQGRSALDLNEYIIRDLSGKDAPEWVVKIDVAAYYHSILHDSLLERIPMDTSILLKLLKAGVIKDGELFETPVGISLGTSLSPILGNMLLDGLQSYLYDHLYPTGNVDNPNGNTMRFADDIIVTARSKEQANLMMDLVRDFLVERGLSINPKKSYIINIRNGFDYLSRHYRKIGNTVIARPSESSIEEFKRKIEVFLRDFHGTPRAMIEEINRKLT